MTQGVFYKLQFIQQLLLYPLAYYFLKCSRSPWILQILKNNKTISFIVGFISNYTLQLYILQETLLYPILKLNFPFPLNIVTFISIIMIISPFVKYFADLMVNKWTN